MSSHTLGPFGKATVILFTAQFDSELPKLAEMKRSLKIPDGKYYRSHGHHSDLCNKLETLMYIVRNPTAEEDSWYRNRPSTDLFVTVADVHSDLFMTLKYSAQIVAGYNLTNAAVAKLHQLLQNRRRANRMRNTCAKWPDTLKDHIAEVKELGLVDPSITEIDINAVTGLTEGYGIAAIEQTTQALVAWHDRYRWRTALEALDRLREATDQELDPELADEQLA
jgi:hypothetical protein